MGVTVAFDRCTGSSAVYVDGKKIHEGVAISPSLLLKAIGYEYTSRSVITNMFKGFPRVEELLEDEKPILRQTFTKSSKEKDI